MAGSLITPDAGRVQYGRSASTGRQGLRSVVVLLLCLCGCAKSLTAAAHQGDNEPVESDVMLWDPGPDEDEPEEEVELTDPEGWQEEADGSIVLEVDERTGQAYRVPDDCDPWSTDELRWVDRTHYAFSRGLCWPTQWLDGVFGDPDDQSRSSSGTSVRIVAAQLLQDDGERDSDVRFRVRAHLPGLERRLSLVFASERDFEDDNAGLPGSPETTGQRDDNTFRAGVNWVLRTADDMDLDMDIGLRSNFKTFWRARYRYQKPISENWSFRLTETVDWRDTRGFRSRSVFDFDRPIDRHTLFRLTSYAEISNELIDDGDGWFWQQSAVLGRELTRRSAMRYLLSVEGITRPDPKVENYRAGVTYRRNTWRPWFYYEVEPYLLWPRETGFRTATGIVLRVETLFGIL